MNGTVVDCLHERIILLGYVGVEQTNQAIVPTSEKDVRLGWVKAQGCDLVVVFCILPYLLILSQIPAEIVSTVSTALTANFEKP